VRPLDAPPLRLDLEIDVWDFALPEQWHFRNVLSWHDRWASGLYGASWTPALERKFFDFLTARRINVTSMYEGVEPYATADRMVELGQQGQNVFVVAALPPEARLGADCRGDLEERLDAVLPRLRDAGLGERALAYGWDERGPDWHGEIRAGAALLATRFHGLPLLMAGVDDSYGTGPSLGGLGNIAYCPLMKAYDPARAAAARARGNAVWWYETHWTIEQPLIRSRLLPWQAFKLGADGFLVWCLNRWVGNDGPIDDQPRTRWNPELDGVEPSSTGVYVYPGIDGPRSSLRLENFRDGIEDYDILKAAEEKLHQLEADDPRSPRAAALRRALALPDDLVRDAVTYGLDPAKIHERRRMLAEALTTWRTCTYCSMP
jgi:hypothetical protein